MKPEAKQPAWDNASCMRGFATGFVLVVALIATLAPARFAAGEYA